MYSDWTKVEADCRKAIQLDHDSVKVCLFFPLFCYNCFNLLFFPFLFEGIFVFVDVVL